MPSVARYADVSIFYRFSISKYYFFSHGKVNHLHLL